MPIKFDLDYACIFNSSKNAMSFTEFDSGTIIDVNAAWISATAIACERAIGTTALELGLWVSEAVRADCVARLHQHGSVTEMEIILLPQGVETLYLVQASPVEIEHQRFVLWEFENISARKQLEAETLAANQAASQSASGAIA